MTIHTLGGYTVVRKLGEGTRAELLLARPADPDAAPVVLKLFRTEVTDESILAEATALDRARGDHVVELLDVTSTLDGDPVLILSRVPGPSLARLLVQRSSLEAGEAITILAPLALALARLHEAGVAYGAIRAEAVRFTEEGAPVLTGFGAAVLIPPGMHVAGIEADPAVSHDLASFARLVGDVLGRAPGTEPLELWSTSSARSASWLDEFADRLFELAEPLPVSLNARDAEVASPIPPRAVPLTAALVEQPPPLGRARLALPEWVDDLIPEDLLDRFRTALSAVRRPVWIAAASVAVALVAALVLVPQPSTDAVEIPTATPVPMVAETGPVAGDDPIAALLVLLQKRQACIRDLSVLCLDVVDQPGSAALASDQAIVRELQAGAELPTPIAPESGALVLVERLGDSAIVSLGPDSKPASVLLMKGEAGWRIRDYLE